MKKTRLVAFASIFLLLSHTAYANFGSNSQLTVKASTVGYGIEYNHSINDYFSLGFNINEFEEASELEQDGIEYDAEVGFQSLALLTNYHPWANGFRMRGGIYYNNNRIDINSNVTSGDITVGDVNFNGAEINLNGAITFKKLSPYLGFGYGSRPTGHNSLAFDLDMGVIFSPASAELSGTCSVGGVRDAGVCSTADFHGELDRESDNLSDSIKDFDLYPVLSMGMTYRF